MDKSAAYSQTSSPAKRAKGVSEAKEHLASWEGLVVKCEARREIISDVAKITAVTHILPIDVLNHFQGKVYEKYNVYRQDSENFVNCKHAPSVPSTKTPMHVGSLIAAAVACTMPGSGSNESSEADGREKRRGQ